MHFESAKSFEWIIVDNDSNDNSESIIKSAYPFVKWINMGYNAGFARANNAGMKLATGEVFLLLNPDTLIESDAILRCFNDLSCSSHIACGVQLLGLDRLPQISGSKFMIGGINHLLPLPYWGKFLKFIAGLFKVKRPSIAIAQKEELVDWISGAFLMVKRSGVNLAGVMDEDFFLYGEEVEWCSRLMKVGSMCIFGEHHIIHLEGQVISKAADTKENSYSNIFDKKGLQLLVSNHLRIRKQYGVFWLLFQLVNMTIGALLYFIISSFQFIFFRSQKKSGISDSIGLIYNVIKIWVLLPKMIINKPHFYKQL